MLARAPILLVAIALLATSPLLAGTARADAAFDGGAFLGDASVHYQLVGAPVPAARAPMMLELWGDVPGVVQARLLPPDGAAPGEWFALDRPRPRAHESLVLFPHEGEWGIELSDERGNTASFAFDVWPAAGAFVEPADAETARGIATTGAPSRVALRLVDAQGIALPAPADAVARVTGPDDRTWEAPLEARDGALVFETVWQQAGEHVVDVSSADAGVPPGSRPPLGVFVVPPEEASVYAPEPRRDAPWGPLALLALAIAAVAGSRARRP